MCLSKRKMKFTKFDIAKLNELTYNKSKMLGKDDGHGNVCLQKQRRAQN